MSGLPPPPYEARIGRIVPVLHGAQALPDDLEAVGLHGWSGGRQGDGECRDGEGHGGSDDDGGRKSNIPQGLRLPVIVASCGDGGIGDVILAQAPITTMDYRADTDCLSCPYPSKERSETDKSDGPNRADEAVDRGQAQVKRPGLPARADERRGGEDSDVAARTMVFVAGSSIPVRGVAR